MFLMFFGIWAFFSKLLIWHHEKNSYLSFTGNDDFCSTIKHRFIRDHVKCAGCTAPSKRGNQKLTCNRNTTKDKDSICHRLKLRWLQHSSYAYQQQPHRKDAERGRRIQKEQYTQMKVYLCTDGGVGVSTRK